MRHPGAVPDLSIVIAIVVVVTAGVSLPATWSVFALLATALPALLAALLAFAWLPNCVRQHVYGLHGRVRVVAFDDQFARSLAFFGGPIPDHPAEARSRMQRRREWIVEQLPMTAAAIEPDARHMQGASTNVANRNGSIGAATRSDAAEF